MAIVNCNKNTPTLLSRGISDSDLLSQLLDLVEVLPILTEGMSGDFDHLPKNDAKVNKVRGQVVSLHENLKQLSAFAHRLKVRGYRGIR